jgi:hypothetical protein
LCFLGVNGLLTALPRGGQLPEDYPLSLNNYMDGLLAKHWTVHKHTDSVFTQPHEVKEFVSLKINIHILCSLYNLSDFSTGQKPCQSA